MTERHDAHSPKNLVTEDYEYFWGFDNSPEPPAPGPFVNISNEFLREIVEGIAKSPVSERSYSQCHHCGARIRYVALLKHLPTGAIIAVGETCLENRFEQATADFQRLRKQAQLDREAHRIKAAAREFLSEQDRDVQYLLVREADFTSWIEEQAAGGIDKFVQVARDNEFVADVRAKLWKYGSLSEAQVNAVSRVPAREAEDERRQAERDAEIKVPAPEGRITFTGVVVSRKFKDNDFGGTWKITIKVTTEKGVWLAWVSEPSSIEPDLGDVVTLTATLTRSEDNESFAFGKRPSKASIVEYGPNNSAPSDDEDS